MGAAARRKGRRGENELADLIGGVRVSEAGSPGPDVEWRGLTVEVKRRKTTQGFSLPDNLLRAAAGDLVALRADRGEWVLCMRPETLLALTEAQMPAPNTDV